MHASRTRRVALCLPAEQSDDREYQQLLALLRTTPSATREGGVELSIVTLVASWPDDPDHAQLTILCERLIKRFRGRSDVTVPGLRKSEPPRDAPSGPRNVDPAAELTSAARARRAAG